jgi:hypothetical protein
MKDAAVLLPSPQTADGGTVPPPNGRLPAMFHPLWAVRAVTDVPHAGTSAEICRWTTPITDAKHTRYLMFPPGAQAHGPRVPGEAHVEDRPGTAGASATPSAGTSGDTTGMNRSAGTNHHPTGSNGSSSAGQFEPGDSNRSVDQNLGE